MPPRRPRQNQRLRISLNFHVAEAVTKRPSIGGQAVLEGVMMRGPASWSVACRKPDETIAVEKFPLPSIAERHPWLKWPLFRGVVVLGESLAIGVKALMISANAALDEEEEQLTDKQLGWTLTISMIAFIGIFSILPVLGTKFIERFVGNLSTERPVLFNLIEVTIRMTIFVGYLLIIGQFKDIRRVFQYHGAEHKTIYAYENGDPLDPAEIDRKYSTLHVRCGTNFLFIVLFLTVVAHIIVDLLVGGPLLPRIALRILAIPLLAGISYEAIKLASRNEDSLFFRVSMLPGLALQRITTKPPSLDQIEVAIAAMQAVAQDIDKPAVEEAPEAPVA